MRNLASIQKVSNLQSIEGKDFIEVATVQGWTLIVKKGEFKVGDQAIYCEIDSILPEKPEFEFLRKRCFQEKYHGFRIKTLKMSGVVSQGILFPLSLLDSDWIKDKNKVKIQEGFDVTENLLIEKYEEDESNRVVQVKRGKIVSFLLKFKLFRKLFLPVQSRSGDFPSFLEKTDETRVQSILETLKPYEGLDCYITVKYDGQSGSFAFYKNRFYICSRNKQYNGKGDSNFEMIAKKYNIESSLKKLCKKYGDIAIQGEICGPNIQKNKYELKELKFFIFSFFNIKEHRYSTYEEFQEYFGFLYKLNKDFETVPFVSNAYKLHVDIEHLLDLAKGNSIKYPAIREGIVIRSKTGEPRNLPKIGSHFSFKVINNEFLLKWDL
ncbi:MAG: RNA ligase family protein [Candidatus Paceibacterota bacterium]|jgi:hypothetical protein